MSKSRPIPPPVPGGPSFVCSGTCRARLDHVGCWARFAAGDVYKWSEYTDESGGLRIAYYRVYESMNGERYAVFGRPTFAERFEVIPHA